MAQQPPTHLIVLGGSVVAVELAQAFQRLGSRVTMLARSSLLSKTDPAIGEGLKAAFEAEGIRILLNTPPDAVSRDGGTSTVRIDSGEVKGDALLVTTGRAPNTDSMALDKAGVTTDERGAIVVGENMRTSVAHVYAAGDCTNQPQFVYVAAAAGARAATNMLGGDAALELSAMPAVIFTDPQVGMVGQTEGQAKAQGVDAESRTLTLDNEVGDRANGSARGRVGCIGQQLQ